MKAKPEPPTSRRARVRRNQIGNYILVSAIDPLFAWSGSTWVAVTPDGLAISHHISEFQSAEAARLYARHAQIAIGEDQ